MAIIEDVKPPGHAEWLERVQKTISSDPAYERYRKSDGTFMDERNFAPVRPTWDGKYRHKDAKNQLNNSQSEAEQKGAEVRADIEKVDKAAEEGNVPTVSDLEIEPPLTVDQ